MKKKKVIFLLYHGRGHFNACFKPAKILSEKNHQVIFAGFAYFKNYVLQQGFDFYPLQTVPFGLGFERWVNTMEKKKFLHWHVVKDRWTDRLYHLREAELKKMLDDLHPDCIIIDSWQSTDFIALYLLLKNTGIQMGFIQTMISTWIDPKLPPVTSPVLPDDQREIKQAVGKYFRQKFKKRIIDTLKYFGQDNDAIINRRIKRNAIPAKYHQRRVSLFSPAFSNIDEFVLAPLEFEFKNFKPHPHQCYIGWMLDENKTETADENYKNAEAEILQKIEKQKLIYCSFGSTDLEVVSGISSFLERLIEFISQKNYLCIISSGSRKISALQKSKFSDTYFFTNVPQMLVLRHASIFITHGGLNSIKEAIHAEVPMLVYPVTKDSDLQGNSARIVSHQLGLRGDLVADSITQIETKIEELISNPLYRNNLGKFKALEQMYSEDKFLEIFQQLKSID
jgi:UDP:flavonoid glycosyltransferase YjiC (YdhE family)